MVYAPQRRHAVASLATGIQSIGLAQHLLTPNILILFARMLAQVQISSAGSIHPHRSLLSLFVMVTALNLTAVLLHFLDFMGGMNGGKGIILDFVGQTRHSSLTRILLLDVGLYLLQLTSLVVSYVTHHSNTPEDSLKSPALPHDDLLLPHAEIEPEEEQELDLESGLKRRRKTRPDNTDEVWLDDEGEDEQDQLLNRQRLLSTTSTGSRSGQRIREPPLIFSLSLPHILNLVFHLPAPPSPEPAFAGGTPMGSPLVTPATERPLPTATTEVTGTSRTTDSATTTATSSTATDERETSDRETTPGTAPSRGLGLSSDRGRIPGEYWVESNRSRLADDY